MEKFFVGLVFINGIIQHISMLDGNLVIGVGLSEISNKSKLSCENQLSD